MFDFAKRIIRSSLSSPIPASVAPVLEAEFFVLDGESWQSLSDGICTVRFDEKAKNGPTMIIACEAEEVSETIALDSVSNLARFVDAEFGLSCFQWIVKKGKTGDNMEEFGLRFQTESQGDQFAGAIAKLAQQTATVVGEFRDVMLVERVDDAKWEEIQLSTVFVSKTKKNELYLSVESNSDKLLFHSPVSAALQLEFNYPYVSFIGLTPLSEEVRVLGLVIENKTDFADFKASLAQPRKAAKAPPVIADEESDVEMWEDPAEYGAVPVASRRPRRKLVSEETNRFMQTGRQGRSAIVISEKDSFGYRAFDLGGSTVGESTASFTKLPGRTVRGALIHEADSKVLLLDAKRTDTVFELDLERGAVVSEWKALGNVGSILPVSQNAASGEKTFLGINDRSLFLMDPRVAGSPVVRAFNYATNVKLSAASTDAEGHIAVGSKSGQIRLFDGTSPNRDGDMKRAKTLLPGLGDPILHVAVSGDWLLATCANYLVLVNTLGGYTKSVTAEPIVLALSQADIVKHKLSAIDFRSAKIDERIILATTGSLAIVWDFLKLKKTGQISYSVKPMQEFILDAETVSTSVVAMYSNKLDLTRVTNKKR